jgi:hypothetical protein
MKVFQDDSRISFRILKILIPVCGEVRNVFQRTGRNSGKKRRSYKGRSYAGVWERSIKVYQFQLIFTIITSSSCFLPATIV